VAKVGKHDVDTYVVQTDQGERYVFVNAGEDAPAKGDVLEDGAQVTAEAGDPVVTGPQDADTEVTDTTHEDDAADAATGDE
jgi:hypothetical protein